MKSIQAKLSTLLLVPIIFVVFFISILITRYHTNAVASHAELSYLEHSPRGSTGGSVIPASCDSYPDHSICECTLGQTTTRNVSVPNGYCIEDADCRIYGDNLQWHSSGCNNLVCDPGYTHVNDYYRNWCKPSCTGNAVMNNVMTSKITGCNQWCPTRYGCAINKAEDKKTFTNIMSIEKAHAAYCVDPIYSNVPIATCVDCPSGTAPDANHVSCITPSVPSVNIHF